jgi:hypothetical protein
LSYPQRWHRAKRSLTPNLLTPRELVTLSTRPPRSGGRGCSQLPTAALTDLRAGDALVSIQESFGDFSTRQFKPRRRPFRLGRPEHGMVESCAEAEGQASIQTWFTAFSDRGRAFYAVVGLGRNASRDRRAELRAVLDSLRFRRRR